MREYKFTYEDTEYILNANNCSELINDEENISEALLKCAEIYQMLKDPKNSSLYRYWKPSRFSPKQYLDSRLKCFHLLPLIPPYLRTVLIFRILFLKVPN